MYTQYTIFIIKKKITADYSTSAAMVFFLGTQERVRNSRGKRAISVPATEVLLYLPTYPSTTSIYLAGWLAGWLAEYLFHNIDLLSICLFVCLRICLPIQYSKRVK